MLSGKYLFRFFFGVFVRMWNGRTHSSSKMNTIGYQSRLTTLCVKCIEWSGKKISMLVTNILYIHLSLFLRFEWLKTNKLVTFRKLHVSFAMKWMLLIFSSLRMNKDQHRVTSREETCRSLWASDKMEGTVSFLSWCALLMFIPLSLSTLVRKDEGTSFSRAGSFGLAIFSRYLDADKRVKTETELFW